MKEKRKHQRLLCYLKAINEETGEDMGHVGDIHHEGLNIVSKDEMPLNDDISICIEPLKDEVKISLAIKGVWNKMNEGPEHYRTGYQIINPSSETVDAIYKAYSKLKDDAKVLLDVLEEYEENK